MSEARAVKEARNAPADPPATITVKTVKYTATFVEAAIVGAYKGLNAGGGPSGVGRAVNESVIIAFMLLFFLNAVITAIYFQVIPPPGL